MINLRDLILETLSIFESEDVKQLEKERMRLYMKVKNWKRTGKDTSELEIQLNDAKKRLSDAKKAARLAAKGAVVTPQQQIPTGDDSVHSVLDVDRMMTGRTKAFDERLIKEFIRDNYTTRTDPDECCSVRWEGDAPYVDVVGDVNISNHDIASLTDGTFKWGVITGGFSVANCSKLKTLEGAPTEVGSIFDCSFCDNLISLIGAPRKCDTFCCNDCTKLKSLEGISGQFITLNMSDCINITSFAGLSSIRFATLNCSGCVKLKNFNGVNVENLICKGCTGIKSLKGLRSDVESIVCRNMGLTSLDGMPNSVVYVDASYNEKLTSLKGMSRSIITLELEGCEGLKDLSGLPKQASMNILNLIQCTGLETLNGCPNKVKKIYLKGCSKLKNIDDLPRSTKVVGMNIDKF